MKLSGWGNYPIVEGEEFSPGSIGQLTDRLQSEGWKGIVRGKGRSYGDTALAKKTMSLRAFNHLLAFDDEKGVLTCQSGLTLEELLEVFIPKGWFLAVTPGTKFVTVGGAIASDVHGKNHHQSGSFCDHLSSLRLLTANGDILDCSPPRIQNYFELRAAALV